LKNNKDFLNDISVSKYGIHDIILELVCKFNFDKFLFPKNLTLVFVTFCMGIILFNNPTATFIAEKLFWVSHDSLTRLLPLVSIDNNNAIILFIQAIQSQTAKLGWLIIDDVIIRKPFGKSIFPTTYVYDHTNNRFEWDMHIVVLLWSCSWMKIPISFRIWKPKEKCEVYHTKGELAMDMINSAYRFGLQAEYVTFDTWYSSKALLNLLKKCNYHYVCMLKNNRKVIFKNLFSLNVKTISMFLAESNTDITLKLVSI